jgi:hypothetical protein
MADDTPSPNALHAGRDQSGRFAAGNPGKPHGAVHRRSRLRAQVAQVMVADFLRHHALHLENLRRIDPRAYTQMVVALTDDGDVGEELDALPALDVAALAAVGEAKKARKDERDAREEAEMDALMRGELGYEEDDD